VNVFDLGARKNFQAVFGVGRCAALLALFGSRCTHSFRLGLLCVSLAAALIRCLRVRSQLLCSIVLRSVGVIAFAAAACSPASPAFICPPRLPRPHLAFACDRFALEWLMPGDPDIGTCALLAAFASPRLCGVLLACLCH
jgi:hypothetical protein